MTADLLSFPNADEDLAIEPDAPEIEMELEIEPDAPLAPAPVAEPLSTGTGLMEVLPADFRLPALIKFVPNPALRITADQSAVYALGLKVDGPEGLERADLALSALRTSLKAIDEHFEDPTAIANALHKRLTSVRGEWKAQGAAAVTTVGQRIFTEQRRLESIAAEERRKAQAEADRVAREAARKEAEAAEKAQAPAAVVEELKRQVETTSAPPVSMPAAAPALRSSSTVTTWKARIIGTPGSDEANPEIEAISPAQRLKVFELLRAILDGKAPLAAVEINWPYLNKRSKADKSTLAIAGIEAYEEGSVRAKGSRSK